MANSWDKTDAINDNERLSTINIINQIKKLGAIIKDPEKERHVEDLKMQINILGKSLLQKFSKHTNSASAFTKYLNRITDQKEDSYSEYSWGTRKGKLTERDQIRFSEFKKTDKFGKIESLISLIENLEYNMPDVIRVSVSSVSKELESLKALIKIEWGEDIFDPTKSKLKHLINPNSDTDAANFQYLVMNALSAKGDYVEFKGGDPYLYSDGGGGNADISIINPNGSVSVGAATLKTESNPGQLSFESDQIPRHYGVEQFIFDKNKSNIHEYLLEVTNADNIFENVNRNGLIDEPRKEILKSSLKGYKNYNTGKNIGLGSKSFHRYLFSKIDLSHDHIERGDIYYFPEVNVSNYNDLNHIQHALDNNPGRSDPALLHSMALAPSSCISEYANNYDKDTKKNLDGLKNKTKTVISNITDKGINKDTPLILDSLSFEDSLNTMRKELNWDLLNATGISDLSDILIKSKEGKFTKDKTLMKNEINALFFSMVFRGADVNIEKSNSGDIALISIMLLIEKFPYAIDLQNVSPNRFGAIDLSIITMFGNAKNYQKQKMDEAIRHFEQAKSANATGEVVAREIIKNGHQDAYLLLYEGKMLAPDNPYAAEKISYQDDPLNIIPLIDAKLTRKDFKGMLGDALKTEKKEGKKKSGVFGGLKKILSRPNSQ